MGEVPFGEDMLDIIDCAIFSVGGEPLFRCEQDPDGALEVRVVGVLVETLSRIVGTLFVLLEQVGGDRGEY